MFFSLAVSNNLLFLSAIIVINRALLIEIVKIKCIFAKHIDFKEKKIIIGISRS